jgi:hypothetical protein
VKSTRASVQIFQDLLKLNCFRIGKAGGPGASVPWIGGRWSTVDSRQRRPRGSPELMPDGISRRQTSPREDQKEEGCSGNLTVRLDRGGALATWPTTRQ